MALSFRSIIVNIRQVIWITNIIAGINVIAHYHLSLILLKYFSTFMNEIQKNKGRVKNVRNLKKDFIIVKLKFCCFHDFSGIYTQNEEDPLSELKCSPRQPSRKYWFQINL